MSGAKAILEILDDKKFSEEDVKLAIEYGIQSVLQAVPGVTSTQSVLDNYTQSLQQTEWDVVVGMECCGNYTPPCNINCEYGPKPKLDAEGNLILKKNLRCIK